MNLAGLPSQLRDLISQLKIPDLISAASKITLAELQRMIELAKTQPLDADLVKRLSDQAKHATGADAPAGAAALVVLVLLFAFPMAAVAPVLSVLGFMHGGPAAASIAAWFQSVYGVNVLFSLLQSAGMGGYGVTAVAAFVRGWAIGGIVSWFRGWTGGS